MSGRHVHSTFARWIFIGEREESGRGLSALQYRFAVTVHRCLRYPTPKYLADCCVPVSDVSGRQRLRSASRRKLNIPRYRRSTIGTCGLSESPVRRFGTDCLIRSVIRLSSLNVLGGLENASFPDIRDMSALEVSPFRGIALYKSAFTYSLTSSLTRRFRTLISKWPFCKLPTSEGGSR